ncbi:hypothetical protein J3459_007695 [Metarhizium acridum]|nr:hypothetical protein J3459_007695 [Metarhizium acridum]
MFLLGRFSMFTGWYELFISFLPSSRRQKEFVSVDARHDAKKDLRNSHSYEMLSRDSSAVVTPLSLVKSPPPGRRTPDYFGQTARYNAPVRSFSSPRAPQTASWDHQEKFARPERPERPDHQDMNPLIMNKI